MSPRVNLLGGSRKVSKVLGKSFYSMVGFSDRKQA